MTFREESDWDSGPSDEDWFCSGCLQGQGCNGDERCASQGEDMHPTQGPYDQTQEPPAYLNPRWILKMRERLEEYKRTGRMDWFPASRGPSAVGALSNNGGV